MAHSLSHPAASGAVKRVGQLFQENSALVRPDRHIVFVCGGPVADSSKLRPRFLEFAKAKLADFRFVLAEDAATDLLSNAAPQVLDLSVFEAQIVAIADCVLMFPESVGSFAELGLFARDKDICSKMLVANDADRQGADSFVNNGPLRQVNLLSAFGATLSISLANPDFNQVAERIRNRLRHKLGVRFTFRRYDAMGLRELLYVIHELIVLFYPVTLDGLLYLLSQIFGALEDADGTLHG